MKEKFGLFVCSECGVTSCKCGRCNKTWVPIRKKGKRGLSPVRCPFCQSPYWNKERKVKKK